MQRPLTETVAIALGGEGAHLPLDEADGHLHPTHGRIISLEAISRSGTWITKPHTWQVNAVARMGMTAQISISLLNSLDPRSAQSGSSETRWAWPLAPAMAASAAVATAQMATAAVPT